MLGPSRSAPPSAPALLRDVGSLSSWLGRGILTPDVKPASASSSTSLVTIMQFRPCRHLADTDLRVSPNSIPYHEAHNWREEIRWQANGAKHTERLITPAKMSVRAGHTVTSPFRPYVFSGKTSWLRTGRNELHQFPLASHNKTKSPWLVPPQSFPGWMAGQANSGWSARHSSQAPIMIPQTP
jgi:hypothetical protein